MSGRYTTNAGYSSRNMQEICLNRVIWSYHSLIQLIDMKFWTNKLMSLRALISNPKGPGICLITLEKSRCLHVCIVIAQAYLESLSLAFCTNRFSDMFYVAAECAGRRRNKTLYMPLLLLLLGICG